MARPQTRISPILAGPVAGLAALLAAAVAPHAAAQDLPVILEPSENTNACAGLGAGYVQLPGTQTCFKMDYGVRTDFSADISLSGGASNSRTQTKGTVGATSVTDTQFGPLRTHVGVSVGSGFGSR